MLAASAPPRAAASGRGRALLLLAAASLMVASCPRACCAAGAGRGAFDPSTLLDDGSEEEAGEGRVTESERKELLEEVREMLYPSDPQ